jgi:hypothetical protein
MYIVFYTFPLVNLGLNNFAIVIVIPQELYILKHCYNDIRFYTLLYGHVLLWLVIDWLTKINIERLYSKLNPIGNTSVKNAKIKFIA